MAVVFDAENAGCDIGFYTRATLAAGDELFVQMARESRSHWKEGVDQGWYAMVQVRTGTGCTASVKYLLQPDFVDYTGATNQARWVDHSDAAFASIGANAIQARRFNYPFGALRLAATGGPCEVEIYGAKRLKYRTA